MMMIIIDLLMKVASINRSPNNINYNNNNNNNNNDDNNNNDNNNNK